MYGYGTLFVLILCAALIIIEKAKLFKTEDIKKNLEIIIPENLNSSGAFDNILDKYTTQHTLTKIKTTDLGSLFKLVYSVRMADGVNEQEFLNELRTRNGNLTIMLSEAQQNIVK